MAKLLQIRLEPGMSAQIDRGKIMIKQNVVTWAARMGLASLVGIGIYAASTHTSSALNYKHQKAAECQSLVGAKVLKADQKKSEFQKCMNDPTSYK
jgi:hypothetical protein